MSGEATARVCMLHSGFEEGLKSLRGEIHGLRNDVRNVRNLLITFLSAAAVTALAVAIKAYS